MKFLITLALLLSSAFAFAESTSTVDLSALPEDQRAAIVKQVADQKALLAQTPEQKAQETSRKVDSYAQVAERISGILPVFAKNLSCSIDTVMNSWTGRFLCVVTVLYLFGSKSVGLLLLTIGPILWWTFFKRAFLLKEEILVDREVPVLKYFFPKKRVRIFQSLGKAREALDCREVPAITAFGYAVAFILLIANLFLSVILLVN